MTNSKWVTLHILWKALSSHLFPWPIASEWHANFMKGSLITSFLITNSLWVDIEHFVKGSIITSFPMTNRKWVTPHILWKALHHIFSYDQQRVGDIAHFVKGGLITCFPITNSWSVGLHILWNPVLSHLFLWTIGCEWLCIYCGRKSHQIFSHDPQEVSDIAHFVKGSLITCFPMTNREWVRLHNLWKAVSSVISYLFLWPTACESHFALCEWQCHSNMQ